MKDPVTKLCQQGVCPCCGASWVNKYQHDPDCRSNAPWPIEHTAHYWDSGAHDARHGVSPRGDNNLVHNLIHVMVQQKVAYLQGYWCTKRKMSRESERTIESLGQAVDTAKGRVQRDHVTLDPSPAA